MRAAGVIQPLVKLKPTSRLACSAVARPVSSCGLQLANARAQSIRPPSIRLDSAKAAAAPLVMPHLLKPVATKMFSLFGRMGPTYGRWSIGV